MAITETIKNCAFTIGAGRRFKDLRIGLGYTAASLETGETGLAYTFLPAVKGNCTLVPDIPAAAAFLAEDLVSMITRPDFIHAAVGLAAANALFHLEPGNLTEGDVLDRISLGPDDQVGMVGDFAPLVGRLRQKAGRLLIFEQIPRADGRALPSSEIQNRLPECSVALITATSIINGSFDAIMEAAAECREVIVLGASTPLRAEVFQDTPVTCLSGVQVTDPAEILRVVSLGGGMRRFKHGIRKVNLRITSRP